MFPTIPAEANHTLPEISLEQFEEINEQELHCIFAESGADREQDFDPEQLTVRYYLNGEFPQLIRTREDMNTELNRQSQSHVDDMEIYEGQQYDECKN